MSPWVCLPITSNIRHTEAGFGWRPGGGKRHPYARDRCDHGSRGGPIHCTVELNLRQEHLGDGPTTVSESAVSNTKLCEVLALTELGLLSAYYLCAKANSLSSSQKSPSLVQNSVSSLFRNSTLEAEFRPFPNITRSFWNAQPRLPEIASCYLYVPPSLGGGVLKVGQV